MMVLITNSLHIGVPTKSICDKLELNIQSGSMVGILGANGSGKSTLLHTLAGLRKPDAGNILLNNKLIQHYSARELARHRGILFQEMGTTLPMTVADYCLASRYPHQLLFQKSSRQLSTFIHETLNLLELSSKTHERITNLSGGEKKRLTIAGLLIQQPVIYFLDEPTNHLDIKYQIIVLNHFKKLADTQQATIIMTLHNPGLAETYCNHVILMQQNGNCQQGAPCNLLNTASLSSLYQCNMTKKLRWEAIA